MNKANVVQFPSGAVAKFNPDGTPSGAMRTTSDACHLNQVTLENQPDQWKKARVKPLPAVTPRIMDMLRVIVTLWCLYPFCQVVGFKRDFANAFKLVHHNLADGPSLASSLPGFEAVVVSSVMVFGWAFSPSWFGLFAYAVVAAFNALSCANPEYNGNLNNTSNVHVDDTLSFFIDWGNAASIRAYAFQSVEECVFGPNAISLKKLLSEGEVSMLHQTWGIMWDLRQMRWYGPFGAMIYIPLAKIVKMKGLMDLLTMEMLVNREVPLSWHQKMQGLAVYMSICCKPLHSVLVRCFDMCASCDAEWLAPFEDVDTNGTSMRLR
jgi:hypothetical protein